eukprot:gnl/MRDRNA2_/MRDRNA2_51689_c0_seq1.p1 gnl/MRDRNA2_/MRDRNA2_51689_c0~~gnl/MRDRNA2_/MRDRNA2_51689_c0_seq1.p1  ORF type:complete len:432 (-),score=68.48 gnl/MRDRNA2_/MRDRNA2_51689_c0_seq1:478-1773(-)
MMRGVKIDTEAYPASDVSTQADATDISPRSIAGDCISVPQEFPKLEAEHDIVMVSQGEGCRNPEELHITLPEDPTESAQAQKTLRAPHSPTSPLTAKSLMSRVSETATPKSPMTAKSWLSGESGLSCVLAPLRKIPVATEFGEMCNRYSVTKVLGQGAFGKVSEVLSRENESLKYACKTISADNLYQLTEFEKELNIAAKLEHPYIVKLHEAFKGKSNYHLVMTLCTGGDLETKIYLHRSGLSMSRNIPANVCLRYWWQMMAGCAYMHHHQICHRDIKAQNYMLETSNDNSPLRLTDFGVATSFTKGKPLTKKCGTLHYMAPEVFNCSYDQKCDVWSIGVTMYYAFSNHLPFLNPDQKIIVSEIQTREPQYTEKAWQNVPDEAKKLLGTLLSKVPNSRPSARKVIQTNEFLRRQRKGEPLGGEDGCCCCIQ